MHATAHVHAYIHVFIDFVNKSHVYDLFSGNTRLLTLGTNELLMKSSQD